MRAFQYLSWVVVSVVLLVATMEHVQASISGGGGLLTAGDATQLESWLGEGPLDFQNIFTKVVGDTGVDFRNAVNGQGRTFTIIEVIGNTSDPNWSPVKIGGYNPLSWDGHIHYHISPVGSRDAFIFNLTTSELRLQNPTDTWGQYQTYNTTDSGPRFGGGHDIYVSPTLNAGYNYSYSYGTEGGGVPFGYSQGIAGADTGILTYGQIEVFTISAASSVVPEPTTFIVWSLLGLVGAGRWRRKSNV